MSTKPVAHFPVRSFGQGVQLSLISTSSKAGSAIVNALPALLYALKHVNSLTSLQEIDSLFTVIIFAMQPLNQGDCTFFMGC
jgi:hypothetical protein